MSAKKAKPAAVGKMPKGISMMTMEKHRFNGYNVRAQKKGWVMRRYVSASASSGTGFTEAYDTALRFREQISRVFGDAVNWRGGVMKAAVAKVLRAEGWTVEGPAV